MTAVPTNAMTLTVDWTDKGEALMSFSTLFFVVACTAMYKLGSFNAHHPGRMRAWLGQAAVWTWKSLSK
jgi:hypothetical protein